MGIRELVLKAPLLLLEHTLINTHTKELYASEPAVPWLWENKVPPLVLLFQTGSRIMWIEYQRSCLDPKKSLNYKWMGRPSKEKYLLFQHKRDVLLFILISGCYIKNKNKFLKYFAFKKIAHFN